MKTALRILATLITVIGVQAQSQGQTAIKKVVLEEFTTVLCGNCPPVSYTIGQWHDSNPHSVLMVIHDGFGSDAMTSTLTNSYFNAFHPGNMGFAPAIMIDRGLYPWKDSVPYMSNGGFDTIATRVMNEPAAVDVQIMNGTYDAVTRSLSATVNATFVSSVTPGDYRINLFLVEDSVTGTGYPAYDQKCYSASFANTHYPGMFDGTHILGYPHRHVMRQALLGTWGAASIIPNTPVIGSTYSKNVTYTVPSTYNAGRLSVVAVVAHYASAKSQKYVLNANDQKVTATFATGIQQTEQLAINNIYPVPATDNVHLVFTNNKQQDNIQVSICDILGHTQNVSVSQTDRTVGTHEVIFNTQGLAKGIYYLTIKTSDAQTTRKFIVD